MPDPTEQLAVIRAEYWDWYEDDDEDRYEDTKSFELVRNRLPHVLAAVESVLALHKPFEYAGLRQYCAECSGPTGSGYRHSWPCVTVRAITDALDAALSGSAVIER